MRINSLMEREYLLELFEFYGSLLTTIQREIFSEYYNSDLSLSEIAEMHAISKAAVSDALNTARNKLLEYEEKLGFKKKKANLVAIIKKIENEKDEEKRLELIARAKEEIHNGI